MPIFLNFICIFQLSSTYGVNSSLVWNSSLLHVMEVNGSTDSEPLMIRIYTHSSPCHYVEQSSKLHVLANFSPVPTEKEAGKAWRESGHYGKEKMSCLYQESNDASAVQAVVQSIFMEHDTDQ